jgi:hypothetical protein
MPWKRKLHKHIPKRHNGITKNYSISNKLRKEGKTTSEFEIMLSSLTLEEIIGLKLELASRSAGGMLYGLPLWGAMPNICKDAVLRYAISASRSNSEAARFLGIDKARLKKLYKKFDLYNYFGELDKK